MNKNIITVCVINYRRINPKNDRECHWYSIIHRYTPPSFGTRTKLTIDRKLYTAISSASILMVEDEFNSIKWKKNSNGIQFHILEDGRKQNPIPYIDFPLITFHNKELDEFVYSRRN